MTDPWLENRARGDLAVKGLAQFGCYLPGGGSAVAERGKMDRDGEELEEGGDVAGAVDSGELQPVALVPLASGAAPEHAKRRPWVGRLPLVASFAHLRPSRNRFDAHAVQRIAAHARDGWVDRLGAEWLPPPASPEALAKRRGKEESSSGEMGSKDSNEGGTAGIDAAAGSPKRASSSASKPADLEEWTQELPPVDGVGSASSSAAAASSQASAVKEPERKFDPPAVPRWCLSATRRGNSLSNDALKSYLRTLQ